jgi:stage II sporulation protein R
MRRKAILGALLLLVGCALVAGGFATRPAAAAGGMAQPQADLSRRVVRLHVVANSDSEADQELKRAVRDAILAEVTPLFMEATSQVEARKAVKAALPRMQAVAAAVVGDAGFTYTVRAELGQYDFPGKAYGETFLPAGRYTALKVLIGEAAGANWWCVLFPPMCFEDWSVGVVREPRPGSGGAATVNAPVRAPALVDESRTESVQVKPRIAAWEWAKARFARQSEQ